MALQIDFEYRGTHIDKGYIRVQQGRFYRHKEGHHMDYVLSYHVNSTEEPLYTTLQEGIPYSPAPKKGDLIQQCYTHAKTLPQFWSGVNVDTRGAKGF